MDVPLEKLEFALVAQGLRARDLLAQPYLEVGCGDGFNLEQFSRLGMRGMGIDISPEAIALVRDKQLKHTEVVSGDFLAMSEVSPPKTIFMLNILEHVHEDEAFLKKAAAILPPGGYLVIAVPGNPEAYGFADANAGHIRRYSRAELRQKIVDAGLVVDEWLDVGFPVNRMYTWGFNLLNRNRSQVPHEEQTLTSGIRHKDGYYGGGFDVLARIAFPILCGVIQLDRLFVHTQLGNNFVVFAKKL